ncbi:hypothetical protein GQ55_1G231900 [Panicum hallii var. hallii]|uniref:Legume lectin domain-containing protein n=1 Tax=Panicum hallii var. hallii TaxID=1504633 RepID=A0A2T7F6P6_9POAL|nr:hypothetical protein GQ55_1G231900 [Panicum hallii var. hallii]
MLPLLLLILLSLHGEAASSSPDDGQFAYQGFAGANLTLDGLAALLPGGLLALTNFTYQTKAHAFHPTPIRFLNRPAATNATAAARSFSTSFVFAIVSRYDGLSDHGLAFVVAPTTDFAAANAGQYLGLLNATNGAASDPILAVELDTILTPEFRDLNSNHVWVDYDGRSKQLEVTLSPLHTPKPRKPLLSEAIDLSSLMADAMYVGFSASSGSCSRTTTCSGGASAWTGPPRRLTSPSFQPCHAWDPSLGPRSWMSCCRSPPRCSSPRR